MVLMPRLIGMQQLMCGVFFYSVKYTPRRPTYKRASKFTISFTVVFFLSKDMSSIITSLFKVTVGFLVDKAEDWAVEKVESW